MTIISAIIVSLAVVYWVAKTRKRPSAQTLAANTKRRQQSRSAAFHAVSVRPGGCGCEAVNALYGERYLTRDDVPNLPLAECTLVKCTCRYVHHEDRRSRQGNRRAAYSFQTEMYGFSGQQDRRRSGGRRSTDAAGGIDLGEIQWNM